ncbi:MAG: hypothetical protein KDD94_09880, partial [Calditrichaeota bacterium]|nr:hypothetical protein [Calditrichota bacterium]
MQIETHDFIFNDRESFASFFELYKNDLYKVLYHRVIDKSLLSDFVQDSFIRLWE